MNCNDVVCTLKDLAQEEMAEIRGGDLGVMRPAPFVNYHMSSVIAGSELAAKVQQAFFDEASKYTAELKEIPDYSDYFPGPIRY